MQWLSDLLNDLARAYGVGRKKIKHDMVMALIFEEGLHFEASDLQVCWVPNTKAARGSWTREGSQGC